MKDILNTISENPQYATIIGAIITALGAIVAAIVAREKKKKSSPNSQRAVTTSLEDRLPDKLKALVKYRMLIIDETSCLPMDIQGTNLIFQLITGRYKKTSIVFISNKTFPQWNEVFTDVAIALAILDCVLHQCTAINMKGESYDLKECKEFIHQKQRIVNTLFEQDST